MEESRIAARVDRAAFSSMFVYASAVNVLPICLVQISGELGFSLTQAGALGFITSLEQFAVLFFSCFVAARFGKIPVLRFSLLVMACGLGLFSRTSGYAAAVAMMLVIGIGSSFLEALLTPLVEDLHPGDSGGRMNLLHSFWSIGVCTGGLIIGELLSRGMSWRTAFLILSAAAVIVSFLYPRSSRIKLPPSRADLGHIGEIVSRPRFWMLGMALFFAGGSEMAFAFWSASYIQLNFGTMPRAGAAGAAAFALGMAVGRLSGSRLAPKLGLKRLIMLSSVCALCLSSVFFLIRTPAAMLVFLFGMGLFIACFWPSIQSYAARVMPVDATSLMILLSCFGIPGCSLATLVMGIIGDSFGLQTAFITAPVCLLMLNLFLVLEKKAG